MFDNYYMFLVDGLIPISNYLWQHVRKKRNIKMLKIPPIADFDLFSIDSDRNQGNYFLYVGSSVYYQPVMKILDAFKKLEEENFNLVLVLHGSGTQKIRNNVEIHPKKNKIFIYSGLSYEDLVQLYVNAKSLIVPLSNSLQDIARFPNKISEYLASSNPIITNRVGEVENYFTDGENALVAELNASDGILEKMQIVVDNPEKAEKIGYKGYELGLKYFDKNSYKKEFETFITNFVSKN
ncbi:glycosyltransferase family 4 protein [Lutimonas saemankumensis]|uniref:glycosyltransferase family 4 protein n=1 Tax=Lutimonas saemankumensis TaxID=483016 RepID=UPI001CD1CE2C|nr:glycosyltransferase family 4 protein [Lutimonas saemankumensis]MCA0931061.1 glycosyltransferase family 4 protein [Lutimonas saemankumensis]